MSFFGLNREMFVADTSANPTGANSFQVNGVKYYTNPTPTGKPSYVQAPDGTWTTPPTDPSVYANAPSANIDALLSVLGKPYDPTQAASALASNANLSSLKLTPEQLASFAKNNAFGISSSLLKNQGVGGAGFTNYNIPGAQLDGGFIQGDWAPQNESAIIQALAKAGAVGPDGKPINWSTFDPKNGLSNIYVPTQQFGSIPAATFASGLDSRNSVGSGGGLLDNVAGFLNDTHIGTLASLAALAVPGLQPLAAGLNVAGGVASGNIGQAVGGAMGLPGVGSAVNGFIGSGLSDLGVPTSLIPDVTKGVIGAGTTALSGGTLGQSLTNGVAAGAGNEVGGDVSKALGTNLSPDVANVLGTAAGAATSSAIKGGDPLNAALMSGIGGAVNGAASSLTPMISGALGIGNNSASSAPATPVSSDNPLTASLSPTGGNKMSYGSGSYSGYAGNYGADVGSATQLQNLGFSPSEIDALLGTNTGGGGIAGPSSGSISGSTTPDMSGISTGGLPAIDPALQAAVNSGKYTPQQLSAMIDSGVFSGTGSSGSGSKTSASGGGLGGTVAGALNSLLGTSLTGSGISSGIGTIGALLAAYQALQGNKGAVSNNASALSSNAASSPYFNASLSALGSGSGSGAGGTGTVSGNQRTPASYMAPSWYPKSYDQAFAPGGGGAGQPMSMMAINGGQAPTGSGGNPVMLAAGGLAQLRMPTARSMAPMPAARPPRLVQGPGGGQDDNVHARLSPGEYIMDADAVSALGDGNNDAGAAKLDQMRENIRAHKRSAPPSKIPPKAKGALSYLNGGV